MYIIKGLDESGNESKYEFDIYDIDNINELSFNKRGIYILGKKIHNNFPKYIRIQYTDKLSEFFLKKDDLLDKLKIVKGDCILFYESDKSLSVLDDIVRWINNLNHIYS